MCAWRHERHAIKKILWCLSAQSGSVARHARAAAEYIWNRMADASLTALYQDIILDHYRRPRNKGTLEHASVSVPMRNPLCGDEITLELEMNGDEVADVRFTGRGCSISQASTSMMTEMVKGKHASEIGQIGERFRAMVMGDADAATDATLGRARSLAGVARFPARVKCALLAWNALERGLASAASQREADNEGIG